MVRDSEEPLNGLVYDYADNGERIKGISILANLQQTQN